MTTAWNIYCDESCHLERDGATHMVIGALACPKVRAREIADALRAIKRKHGIHPKLELKWTKVSPKTIGLFSDYLDYFLNEKQLMFRAVVIQKDQLDHHRFGQTHDEFYYKMYFLLLAHMPLPVAADQYIYLDIKDTRSEEKVQKLARILRADMDYGQDVIKRVQHIRSDEAEQAQLADILIGAIGYVKRGLRTSPAKMALIEQLRSRTRLTLTKTTAVSASKINLFMWKGSVGA